MFCVKKKPRFYRYGKTIIRSPVVMFSVYWQWSRDACLLKSGFNRHDVYRILEACCRWHVFMIIYCDSRMDSMWKYKYVNPGDP